MKTSQWKMISKIGTLYIVASEVGLRGVFWKKQSSIMATSLNSPTKEIKILAQATQELNEYFAGERKKFTVPLDVQGTPFQNQVWRALRKIPYGNTVSYSDIAKKIKNEKAVRAVGTANGKNPLCIIVPCHRVIAADGRLGGYSAGLKIKTQLLALEERD